MGKSVQSVQVGEDTEEGQDSTVRPRLTHGDAAFQSVDAEPQRSTLELLGGLAAGVVHDLNNVFMVLGACAEEVRTTLPHDHPARESLNDLLTSLPQGRALTRELLQVARGKATTTGRAVPLNTLVLEVAGLFRRLRRRLSVIAVVDPELDALEVDADVWTSVLTNLAVNAEHAMGEGGTLTFRTRFAQRDGAGRAVPQLLVEDTGEGFDAETAAKIFTPFYTTKPNGTGLGLANVKRNVEAAGASIAAESLPGVGTTFCITFENA